jgi:hypothetical protein
VVAPDSQAPACPLSGRNSTSRPAQLAEQFGVHPNQITAADVFASAGGAGDHAPARIGLYLDFYNTKRSHQSLDGATPDQTYFTTLPLRAAA